MRTKQFLAATAMGIILLGCATQGTVSTADQPLTESPSNAERAPADGNPAQGNNALLPVSLRTMQPAGDQPVFLGVADRLRDREEEIARALLHAAEQAARFQDMRAAYVAIGQRGSAGTGFEDGVQGSWDANVADQLLSGMDIVASVQTERGSYVLATHASLRGLNQPVRSIAQQLATEQDAAVQAPGWISSPPVVAGHFVAVGSSRRSRSIRNSIDLADQEALVGLLIQAGSSIRMIEDRRGGDRQGVEQRVTSSEAAQARLRGFQILARHVSDDGRYVYSLAIAEETLP